MTNRYDATCNTCRSHVPAGNGTLSKVRRHWRVTCHACLDTAPEAAALAISRGNKTSYGVVTSTGWVGYRNRAGRCEDAPCCGCCTF